MSARPASAVLLQLAVLLELHGAADERVRALQAAAKLVEAASDAEFAAGTGVLAELADEPRAVLAEFAETNSVLALELLQEETPEGLLEMLRVPGLGPARIRRIHQGLGIETLQALEVAATDGSLAGLPRFGDKLAERVRIGIASLREAGAEVLHGHALADAERVRARVAAHSAVLEVMIAGGLRRGCETVVDVELVASVRGTPSVVAAELAHGEGVREVLGGGGRTVTMRLVNGMRCHLTCVRPEQFAVALWRATGSVAHVSGVLAHAAQRGMTLVGDELRDADGSAIAVASEAEFFAALGLADIAPELREDRGEIAAAAAHELPALVSERQLAGAVHCHSHYSDGGSAVADLASAARARGWRYLGISDHSQSNTYANGLSRDAIERQHDEIDALNERFVRDGVDFRLLKGIEADILPCGRVDYDPSVLDRFDFVIASVHTRYGMNARQMTDRVLKALEDPHLTILGHPTGRLLLTREAYAIDMAAIIERAGELGVAVELNADPHRLDIDAVNCKLAKQFGALVSIGPDAHSPAALEHIGLGVRMARRGWLSATDVLNTRSADAFLAFARARRQGQHPVTALQAVEHGGSLAAVAAAAPAAAGLAIAPRAS